MVFVLTGPLHCGKTTFLKQAAFCWQRERRRVGGFLSEARREGNQITGYDLFDLKKKATLPFLRREGDPAWSRSGPFYFLPRGLERARRILRRDQDLELLVVDEVGPLEIQGGGLWPALAVAFSANAKCLCVVRQSLLKEFQKKAGEMDIEVFRCGDTGTLKPMTDRIFGKKIS